MIDAARDEALNAVEFYNRPGGRRPLEAFLVHMHIAWLCLLHAEFERDGINYHYKKPNGRYVRTDGRKKSWDLKKSATERWPDQADPVRLNLETTIRLRNQIEHKHEEGLITAASGFNQALIINFEEELVGQFGAEFSIADMVHLPVSLGTFSREGAARLVAAQQGLPKPLKEFFVSVRNDVPNGVLDDRQFEFRVALTQKRSSKTDADLAVSFVRADDLSADELKAYESLEKTGQVIIRDKERPVAHPDDMLPSPARDAIEARIPFRFTMNSFVAAWKKLAVRPLNGMPDSEKTKTKAEYCIYDKAHDGYVYTPKFVEKVADECRTSDGFKNLIGREPVPKN